MGGLGEGDVGAGVMGEVGVGEAWAGLRWAGWDRGLRAEKITHKPDEFSAGGPLR